MNLAHISSSLIFIIAITTLTGEKLNNCSNPNDICLPYYVIPVHYRIKLTHYMEIYDSYWAKLFNLKNKYDSFNFYGEFSTNINILQSTYYIKLHLDLIINTWKITFITNNGIIYVPNKYTQESEMLVLQTPSVIFPGFYTLKMEFVGLFTEDSAKNFFRTFYSNKTDGIAWLLASHIQANGVRQLFPCWDEPHLKATFTISIMHHRNFTVLSNMPRIPTSDIDDFVWTHFRTTPPISTFQIAIVITNYPNMYINENISLWCEICSEYNQSLKFARRVIENTTLHLQSEFSGIKIPKMDHVALPNFPHDGTSKWGLIFHREADLICDEQLDSVMRKMKVARLIAPKIAYQWFGNVLSPSWWSQFWLHDGLATLFAEEAIVKIINNSELMDFFIVQSQYESLHLDSHFDMNPAQINSSSETDSIFHFPRYIKVLIILRMWQNEIFDEMFRKNVSTYLYQNTFSSMIPYEIWSTIREKLSNTNPYYMPDEFLNWTKFKHYPIVSWTETFSSGKLAQYLNATNYGKWWLPISITNQFLYPRIFKIRLTSQKPYIYFNLSDEYGGEHDLILVDIKQAGYYRVNYDSENWHKIIHYLNSKFRLYKNISVINRAKMIDDAFHLMMERQLNVSIFWKLTNYLSQETDYVAWYPMIKVFEYMSTIFPSPSMYNLRYAYIKEKFIKLLDEPLRTLGFEENIMDSDFTKCLRQEIVKWACTLDHPECLIAANHKLYHYLQNREKYPVLSEWEQWTYCKSLSGANENTWKELNVILLRRQPDPNLLPFLACCVMERYKIARNLPFVFNQFTLHKKPDIKMIRSQINIFFSVVVKFASNHFIFSDLLLNLPDIKPEEIKTLTALTVIINNIYYFEQLEHIKVKKMKILSYINVEQLSMIELKLIKHHAELENHANHFQALEHK